MMGYDVVVAAPSDRPWLEDLVSTANKMGPPLLFPSEANAFSSVVLPRGRWKIHIVGVQSGQRQFQRIEPIVRKEEGPNTLTIVVSYLSDEANRQLARIGGIDLIVEGHPGINQVERIGNVWLLPVAAKGEVIGYADVLIQETGRIELVDHRFLPLTNDLSKDLVIERFLQDYYDQVATLLLSEEPSESERPVGLSASACALCHEAAYKAWQRTTHARALDTLVRRDRQRVPECLACHSEIYRKTGQINQVKEIGPGIQCQSCHGDGLIHALNPYKGDIVRRPEERKCRECHTRDRSPGFKYRRFVNRIRH